MGERRRLSALRRRRLPPDRGSVQRGSAGNTVRRSSSSIPSPGRAACSAILERSKVSDQQLLLPPGNSVHVERAQVVHQRGAAAPQELRPLRGRRPVAEGRGWGRGLRGRAAHRPHLLFLEEKQEVWIKNDLAVDIIQANV